jgi:hypothetical protein
MLDQLVVCNEIPTLEWRARESYSGSPLLDVPQESSGRVRHAPAPGEPA